MLWTTILAESYGGAAVQDGQVFILDRIGEGAHGCDTLHCLQLTDGKELWHFSYSAPGEFDLTGTRGTPAVDAECVYTLGPMGHLYCLDRRTHTPRWQANLLRDFHGVCPRWGVAQSPLLYRDLLIVAPQSATTGVAALDKRTGKVRWRSAPLGLMSYASPLLTEIDGRAQIVMLTSGKSFHAQTIVAGIDPATGKMLWRYTGWKCLIPVPCPTPSAMGAFSSPVEIARALSFAYGMRERGGAAAPKLRIFPVRLTCKMPSAISNISMSTARATAAACYAWIDMAICSGSTTSPRKGGKAAT